MKRERRHEHGGQSQPTTLVLAGSKVQTDTNSTTLPFYVPGTSRQNYKHRKPDMMVSTQL